MSNEVKLNNNYFLDLLPIPFEGFRLVVNKGLSNHFQVSHTLNLTSAPQGSSYHFGATYVGGNQLSPTEVVQSFYFVAYGLI